MVANPLQSSIDLLGGQAARRKVRTAVPLLHTDDDVAAVQILEVIRERTDGAEYLRSRHVRIPRCLELDALRLHSPAVEKVV